MDPSIPPDPKIFIIPERDICSQLGVPRSLLRQKRREQKRGSDWDLVDGHVAYSASAAMALANDLTQGDVLTPPEKKNAPTTLLVVDTFHSGILMACIRPEDWQARKNRDLWCIVRIISAGRAMFMPGMKILAEEIPGERAWRFLGNPDQPDRVTYPRRRGIW